MKREITDFWPDWVLGEVIGEGANGIVCRAWKKDPPDTQAAVKIFEKVRNPEHIRKEIQCLQQLKGHPSITVMDDFAAVPREDGGMDVYLRMELLTPLRDFFANRNISEEEIGRMGIQLCEALSFCHQKGILHGDIKPGNILVDARDPEQIRFKLSDFSESEMLNRVESLKQSSFPAIHGTMDYIAPEAEKGHPEKRSDLYSLGLTLYRYLNHGNLPFMPERKIQNEDDRRVSNRIRLSGLAFPAPAEASPKMAEVILKACAFHPEDRYSSADDFAEALRSALSAEKKQERVGHRGWLWASAACLVLVVSLSLLVFGHRAAPADSRTEKNADKNSPGAVSEDVSAAASSGNTALGEAAHNAEAVFGETFLDGDALLSSMERFREAFSTMNTAQVPASLTDFPLAMEAWRFAPRLQAESISDTWLLRAEGQEEVQWGLRGETAEDTMISPSFDPERQVWIFTPEQQSTAQKLVASKSFSEVNIDYDYDPKSLLLTRIALWTQSPDGDTSFQVNVNGQGEPEYFCILRNPSGLNFAVYDPEGLPVPEETSFTRLESRVTAMEPIWKEQFEPALQENRFCFPADWTDVPFVLSPEEAPTLEVDQSENEAFLRFSEHVPASWCVMTGNGIPVSFSPCSWDPEARAWRASAPFDRIRLTREGAPDSLTVQIDYEKGRHFLPNGPIVSLEHGMDKDCIAFNCYMLETAQTGQGGVFAQVRGDSAFYAFYNDQGKLDHYNNDSTGCVYGSDGVLREGTEPEGYANPVVIGLP